MASGIITTPWTRQPQIPIALDRANPITRGIRMYGYRGLFFNGDGSPIAPTTATLSLKPTPLGMGLAGTSTGRVDLPAPFTSGSATLLHFGCDFSTAGVNHWLGLFLSSTNVGPHHYIEANAALTTAYAYSTSASNWTAASIAGSPLKQSGSTIVAAFNSGAERRMCIDGSAIATDSTARTVSGWDIISIGSYRGAGGAQGLYGSTVLDVVWDRALSDTELQQISKAPWKIFAPIQRRIWVPVSAAGGSFKGYWARKFSPIIGAGKGY